MPALPIQKTLRLGTIAAAALSLLACGGGDLAEPQIAQASDAASEETASRASTLAAGALPAGPVELVSSSSSGAVARADIFNCHVSANGRLVLLATDATHLVPGDTNASRNPNLYLKNRDTGAVMRVTTQSNGTPVAAGGDCLGTTMTPDARLVAFNSEGAVYVKNTQTGQLVQASPPAGTVPQVRSFFGGVLSDDGRKIVFITQPEQRYVGAYNFVNVVPARLMVRDLETGSLETVAADNGIVAQGEVISISRFAISPDGTRVAFVSSSSSLVPGDANNRPDVFVRDLVSGGTTLASSTSEGLASNGGQYWNVNFVSNTQLAFNTAGISSLGDTGLYLKDLPSGALRLLLSASDGGADARLSGEARKVVFQRFYRIPNGRVFVRDLATGQEALVSASASGTPNNNTATSAILSRDGSTVVFDSNSRNLVTPRPPAGGLQVYAKTISAAIGAN